MDAREKLKNLLSNELMPDLEEAIDEIFMMVEKEKMISLADREELEEARSKGYVSERLYEKAVREALSIIGEIKD